MDNQTTVNVNKKLLWLILGIILIAVIAVFLNYFKIISLPNNLPLISKLPVSKPVPGSCKILEEKYCNKVEKFTVLLNGREIEYLGYKNIPAGTPIYAPFDGFFTTTNETAGSEFSGNRMLIIKSDNTGGADIRGAVKAVNTVQRNIKFSDTIGYAIEGKTIKNYNFVFTVTTTTPKGPSVDETALRQLFPKAKDGRNN